MAVLRARWSRAAEASVFAPPSLSVRDDGAVTPGEARAALADSTAVLLRNIRKLSNDEVRAPSLLAGWTRGHVLAHLAQNAEGGGRLLGWARTGVPSYEYMSLADRARDIEAESGQPALELIAHVGQSAARFAEAAARVPSDRWRATVRYTGGKVHPATVIVPSRLAEVLFHHVDLDLGFAPADWPGWFVRERLTQTSAFLTSRGVISTPVRLLAADTEFTVVLGNADDVSGVVLGSECSLLAWLYGRSDGADLTLDPPGRLPEVPPIY